MLEDIFDMIFDVIDAVEDWITSIGSALSWNIWNFVIASIIIFAIYRLILRPLLGSAGGVIGGSSDQAQKDVKGQQHFNF